MPPGKEGPQEVDPPTDFPTPEDRRDSTLFRSVWRWHFFAGLFVLPVTVILCLSGIVYLFKPQLDNLIYGELRSVEPAGAIISYDDQLSAVESYLGPAGEVSGVGPPPEADRSTEFAATNSDGRRVTVYVDPYTAEVLGERDNKNSLTQVAFDLHSTLLAARFMDPEGKWGDRLIELTASWAVVLVLTGIYLWWPRGRRRSFREALKVRGRGRGGRTWWRDLHAVTGVLFSFVFLFFLITGLAWTGGWGERVQRIAADTNRNYPTGTFGGAESQVLDDVAIGGKPSWSIGQSPLARSGAADLQKGGRQGELRWNPEYGAPLDAVIGRAEAMGFPPGYSIAFPVAPNGTYAVTLSPDLDPQPNQSAFDIRYAYIDRFTAEPVADFEYSEFGIYAKAFDFGIAVHEGRQFGLLNQILTLLTTLALLFTMAAAVVMWLKRRPEGLGAPRRPPSRRLGFAVLAVTLALSILFPMVGLSILVILAVDFLVVRRIPRLRKALGG